MELLISIKGITPLIALASLADVADVRRFTTPRKMNAYLGLVPRAGKSGGKSQPGHITRESRKLTRNDPHAVRAQRCRLLAVPGPLLP